MPNAANVPFRDPPYLNGLPSPYYSATHLKWQKACRAFMDEHFSPYTLQWERDGKVPEHVFDTFLKHNMLVPSLPAPLPVQWLKKLGIHDILGVVKVEEWDYIHMGIYTDEISRSGLGGPPASLNVGFAYGIPPIIKFGSQQLQEKFLPALLRGEKRICIAITEPDAGSDVANVTTTAEKSSDGKRYIVNGTKKWITNGIWSNYATMAVRTGGPGPGGLSLLVVPLIGQEGVNMRKIEVGGGITSGTSFIQLEDVEVPVENLIGQEGAGMKYIMTNFNHERLTIAIGATRSARAALGAAMEYVMKREAFGQPLINQAVVRQRLARAGALVETQWAWVESFVYQMAHLKKEDADRELGGLIAMCKAQAGIVLDDCARTAVLLFGGNGYTRSGQGELVESELHDGPLLYLLTWSRNIQGGTWFSDSRWLGRCHDGPWSQAARQELSSKDEGSTGRIEALSARLAIFRAVEAQDSRLLESRSCSLCTSCLDVDQSNDTRPKQYRQKAAFRMIRFWHAVKERKDSFLFTSTVFCEIPCSFQLLEP
jgi:acyl-CoA dehydrogenase